MRLSALLLVVGLVAAGTNYAAAKPIVVTADRLLDVATGK